MLHMTTPLLTFDYAANMTRHPTRLRCNKIAEAEAAVSVKEKKLLVMHMHVQLKLDELRGPQQDCAVVQLQTHAR
jgi:hypothetical protein